MPVPNPHFNKDTFFQGNMFSFDQGSTLYLYFLNSNFPITNVTHVCKKKKERERERESENLSLLPIPNSSFIPQAPLLTAGYPSFQNVCNVPQTAYKHVPEVCF